MVETIKKRNIALFIFLGFITCGIYWIVVFCKISKDINRICEGDGRDTMFYLWTWLLGIVTLGIYPLVWFYKAMDRLCDNGYRYAVRVKHSGGDFLLWTLLGSFIAVGPIVAYCYFVADINQFEPFVGYVEPKPYSENPLVRAQYEREPLKAIEYTPVSTGTYGDPGNASDPNTNSNSGMIPNGSDGNGETTALTGAIAWLDGQYNGCQFPVDPGKEVIIGRDPSVSNIVIDGKYTTVSKRHCGIRFDPFSGLYTVTDYSSNGTYINGGTKLQPHTPLQLQPNTVVSIGKGSNSFRLN